MNDLVKAINKLEKHHIIVNLMGYESVMVKDTAFLELLIERK